MVRYLDTASLKGSQTKYLQRAAVSSAFFYKDGQILYAWQVHQAESRQAEVSEDKLSEKKLLKIKRGETEKMEAWSVISPEPPSATSPSAAGIVGLAFNLCEGWDIKQFQQRIAIKFIELYRMSFFDIQSFFLILKV